MYTLYNHTLYPTIHIYIYIYIYIHIKDSDFAMHRRESHPQCCLRPAWDLLEWGAILTGFQTGSGQTVFLQKCRNIP